ncbi:hypothetical protein [Pseudomonas sp. ACM7]|uniref:hypothetical protein n=1 Tax=Pseudomonas sp. ACM7 TaxID=2052956 RepID=UPI001012DFA6|nr:hypothetical protein [Pseudomonas sp. ACM7]QAY88987.1 hypothetical protein CUN63_03065 [Pseudomonas sp. ACM7]
MNTIDMESTQLARLKVLQDKNDYQGIYGYMHEVVSQQLSVTTDTAAAQELKTIANWLVAAKSINSNDHSFYSDMVRGSMSFAVVSKGRVLTSAGFQAASDSLAHEVAGHVLAGKGIPPLDVIINADVNSAVEKLKLNKWNWAGTIGDVLPPPAGLGQDFVQIAGEGRVDYAKNITIALLQNMAGLNRFLGSLDTPFDSLPNWKRARDLKEFLDIQIDRIFGSHDDVIVTSEPQQLVQIDINANPQPQPQTQIQGESKAQQDVANGFIQNAATHNIFALGGILNKTDFTSTQMASLASGGIRPGEMQLDLNARPNTYLSNFYQAPNSTKPDFSLRSAVTLNGLSAMSTFNTYVDPLLLDLTGNGVHMTDIRDGVLFDTDHGKRGQIYFSEWFWLQKINLSPLVIV